MPTDFLRPNLRRARSCQRHSIRAVYGLNLLLTFAAFGGPMACESRLSAEEATHAEQLLPPPPDGRRLHPEYPVWIDGKRGEVVVDGKVTLRRGVLEMFACRKHTKEHESIVAVDCEIFIIHAALLKLGAEPGSPALFVPDYAPPTGSVVEVTVQWQDETGEMQEAQAKQWVRGVKSQQPLELDWVFAGSSFWRDETTGESHYQAEAGFFICVANFGSAMLDIPVASSDATGEQVFEANTEKIPPLETPVRLRLKPRLEKE